MKKKLTIATRGSVLALWQAREVKRSLLQAWPQLDVELIEVKTTGDAVLDKPLHEIGDKALFTKELEYALLEGAADLCVHSMKDVQTELPDGCELGAMLPRADVRDVLVCGPRIAGCTSLEQLPDGTRLGTGSLRRAAQLKAQFSNIVPKSIRGNVDTRLKKAFGDEYEGVILAAAGVERMGQAGKVGAYLTLEQMVPAAGQGAIGIEIRKGDRRVAELVGAVNCTETFECVCAERRVLSALGGSCKVPVGVHIRRTGDEHEAFAIVSDLNGSSSVRIDRMRGADGAHALAGAVLERLEAGGAREVLASVLKRGDQ